ncbi:hypothetical protein X777_16595 [Ooceraea biroi]|uniref:Uncharacterized protein n=1 Tax=Ooceraea biroi TaxID=2015173 RepID=A0A026VU18_OOCBI|nr:hypothetical protein X777_16595 [Ooceraea biroi]
MEQERPPGGHIRIPWINTSKRERDRWRCKERDKDQARNEQGKPDKRQRRVLEHGDTAARLRDFREHVPEVNIMRSTKVGVSHDTDDSSQS